MRRLQVYLDSGVVFELGRSELDAERLVKLQQHRRLRAVIGFRAVWEMAKGLADNRVAPEVIQHEARLLLRLLDCGARLACDGWVMACQGVRLPQTKRLPLSMDPLFGLGSSDDLLGREQLRMMAAGEDVAGTVDWYERQRERLDPSDFLSEERAYLSRLRERGSERGVVGLADVRHVLEGLEQSGYLSDATAVVAKRIGMRGAAKRRVHSDWFGPLGRLIRAQHALSIVQATRIEDADKTKPRDSDLADLLHIVVAGIVGSFVTKDWRAKLVFNATWPAQSRSALMWEPDFLPLLAEAP